MSKTAPTPPHTAPAMRLDKWLWCARFYKTRALAVQAIERHHVRLNDQPVKPARDVRPGDTLTLRQGLDERTVHILALTHTRGPAPVAQQLYAETPESLQARTAAAATRRLAPEPAHTISQGRPTKRDRRALEQQRRSDWGTRWSATLDE